MKKIIILSIVTITATTACKKERTCDCTVEETTTTVTTPRSAGSPSTTVREQKGTNAYSYSKVSEKEFRKYYDCNSKETTTSTTGTTNIIVTKTETINGVPFTTSKLEIADQQRTGVQKTDCEIK